MGPSKVMYIYHAYNITTNTSSSSMVSPTTLGTEPEKRSVFMYVKVKAGSNISGPQPIWQMCLQYLLIWDLV